MEEDVQKMMIQSRLDLLRSHLKQKKHEKNKLEANIEVIMKEIKRMEEELAKQ